MEINICVRDVFERDHKITYFLNRDTTRVGNPLMLSIYNELTEEHSECMIEGEEFIKLMDQIMKVKKENRDVN